MFDAPSEPARPPGRHILVAFNKIAGAGGRETRVASLLKHLQEAGFEATVCPDEGLLVSLVQQLDQARQLRGVIAAGGDGTISWVANRVPPSTPLVAFPLGTENLLARYLGHAADPLGVVDLFENGVLVALDAGEANGRLFSLMAGCGFDAEVVEQLHRTRRGNIRHWSYLRPLLDTLWSYEYPRLTVRVTACDGDGQASEEAIECRWAFVINVPRYALGIQIDSLATPLDGQLNVVTFRDGSLLCGLNYLSAVTLGTHVKRSDVCFRRATKVQIECAGDGRFQLDGDPGGELPVTISCLPQRLKVLVTQECLTRIRPPASTLSHLPSKL